MLLIYFTAKNLNNLFKHDSWKIALTINVIKFVYYYNQIEKTWCTFFNVRWNFFVKIFWQIFKTFPWKSHEIQISEKFGTNILHNTKNIRTYFLL